MRWACVQLVLTSKTAPRTQAAPQFRVFKVFRVLGFLCGARAKGGLAPWLFMPCPDHCRLNFLSVFFYAASMRLCCSSRGVHVLPCHSPGPRCATLLQPFAQHCPPCLLHPLQLSPGSLTSSLVDDVFFIMRKCGRRVLASGSVQVRTAEGGGPRAAKCAGRASLLCLPALWGTRIKGCSWSTRPKVVHRTHP
jgi:hypothetical protein